MYYRYIMIQITLMSSDVVYIAYDRWYYYVSLDTNLQYIYTFVTFKNTLSCTFL